MLKAAKTLNGHQNPIYAICQNPNGQFFYTAGNDKGVVEWNLDTLEFSKVVFPVQSSVYVLIAAENFLIAGDRNGQLSIYNLEKNALQARISAHIKPIFSIAFSKTKRELIVASEDGSVSIWNMPDFNEMYRFQVSPETVRCIALSEQLNEIAFGAKDGNVYLYELKDYGFKKSFKAHDMAITALNYHPKQHYLISGSRDAHFGVWDCSDQKPLNRIPAHLFAIYAIAFHPTLALFATASQDKSIKIWDSINFKLYKILSLEKNNQGHRHSVNNLCWSEDGRNLISISDDRQVMIWSFNEF